MTQVGLPSTGLRLITVWTLVLNYFFATNGANPPAYFCFHSPFLSSYKYAYCKIYENCNNYCIYWSQDSHHPHHNQLGNHLWPHKAKRESVLRKSSRTAGLTKEILLERLVQSWILGLLRTRWSSNDSSSESISLVSLPRLGTSESHC